MFCTISSEPIKYFFTVEFTAANVLARSLFVPCLPSAECLTFSMTKLRVKQHDTNTKSSTSDYRDW